MINFKKIKLKEFKNFLKRLPKNLAQRAFLVFLGLFFLSLILGGIIFYKYLVLVQRAKPKTSEKILQFEEKTYEKILKFWQEREERMKEADLKEYPNPFK